MVAADAGSEVRRGGGESSKMVGSGGAGQRGPLVGGGWWKKYLAVENGPERADAEKKRGQFVH